ncbi:MAG TPA: SAM-dependent methyltransferase [Stellaceae bacterium]|nr:SAM-dependent methyltransferase [Stellaceae bacterium]
MSALEQFVVPRLRDYWVRFALRRVHYADRADKLDQLYRIENPWHMDSAKEQARFAWTNRLIEREFRRPSSILEIGCGEGHQSHHLARVCDRLCGVDVSARAVRRAARRCPGATFATGDPFSFRLPDMPAQFDLVVACEVVYYVKDVAGFLARLSQLGRTCLVTYYHGQAAALESHLEGVTNRGHERFSLEDTEWNAIWWRQSQKAIK